MLRATAHLIPMNIKTSFCINHSLLKLLRNFHNKSSATLKGCKKRKEFFPGFFHSILCILFILFLIKNQTTKNVEKIKEKSWQLRIAKDRLQDSGKKKTENLWEKYWTFSALIFPLCFSPLSSYFSIYSQLFLHIF